MTRMKEHIEQWPPPRPMDAVWGWSRGAHQGCVNVYWGFRVKF